MNDLDDLSATLWREPVWEQLNAYEMSKRCCAELTKRGQKIPSWMHIRDIIGKGSANDINRGKRDFRQEHANVLRKMEGFVDGIPDAMTPHVLNFWTAAVSLAQERFEEQTTHWQHQVEQAKIEVQQTQTVYRETMVQFDALQERADGLQSTVVALQGQLNSEQAVRKQTERMLENNKQDLIQQRDELRAALAHAQQEWNRAITRLEGIEKHELLQINQARDEARRDIENIEIKAKQEYDRCLSEKSHIDRQLRDVRVQLTQANQQRVLQEQDNVAMRDRLQRAETQVDHLSLENARLTETLQNMIKTQNETEQSKSAIAKKRRLLRRKHERKAKT